MPNSNEFLNAAEVIKQYTSTLTINDLQGLYGFYKQATVGDINIEKPGFFDFKQGKKWDMWNSCKGMSQYDAEVKYIVLVNEIITRQI